ncbi:ABC transporter permease [Breznakia pachnodae]|uniref:ABC3 transporter permease C-terminal domain-containing protein n=1 Tax=Breznakia pachnodae TaxID=265178 RepID=A0ABU0DYT8_9FIRM|nr:ABC transporter permease [Breznakia pachnodae]MDQ0359741.1 hypothetical protein [Breznakia pachnodae]
MLKTLSLRNAKRQAKDYLIYFITMIISVALIYAFNGLVFSKEISELGELMSFLPYVIIAASILIIFIIGWLVSYTMNFILHKRSKELGTYILLGIEQKQVAKMFFIENLVIGSIALLFGVVVGNLIYQLIYMMVMYNFQMPYTFNFSISLGTIGLTLLYFVCIYLFALMRTRKKITKMKIYDLINYDKKNEEKLVDVKKQRVALFFMSVVAGIAGLLLILLASSGLLIMVGFVLVIGFLYGFFISLSSFATQYLDMHPKEKYQGNKLFIMRTLLSKISSMSVTMATLSLLFSITIAAVGSGLLFSSLFESRIEKETAYDLSVTVNDSDKIEKYVDYIDNSTIDVTQEYTYTLYQSDTRDYTTGMEERGNAIADFDKDVVMKYSDYEELREMLNLPEVYLDKDKFMIHCIPAYEDSIQDYVANHPTFTLNDDTVKYQELHTENFSQSGWFGNGNGLVIIVPDEIVIAQPEDSTIYAAMTGTPITEEEYTGIQTMVYDADANEPEYAISREIQRLTYSASTIIFVFPLYYIALIMIMVAATILSIQHLSEISKNKYRYQTLYKLGVDKGSLRKTMRKQLGIYFALPAVPALMISTVMIHAFGARFETGVAQQVWSMIGISVLLFMIVYAIYICATYTSFKRNVLD